MYSGVNTYTSNRDSRGYDIRHNMLANRTDGNRSSSVACGTHKIKLEQKKLGVQPTVVQIRTLNHRDKKKKPRETASEG